MYATITKTGRIGDSRRIRRQAGCRQPTPPWEAQSGLSHDSAACIIATDWQRRDQLDLPSGSRAHRKFEDPAARVNSLFCARKVLMNYREVAAFCTAMSRPIR